MGVETSAIVITAPFNLEIFGVILGIWVAQLGLSSGAYYYMSKADHQIELPIALIQELPEDIKEKVDMTELITAALNCNCN